MTTPTYESFSRQKLAEGFDQVLVREWEPGFANEPHSHPFDTDALVARGEFWLTVDGQTMHFSAGDRFKVARGVVHAERYGSAGATFWAARRH